MTPRNLLRSLCKYQACQCCFVHLRVSDVKREDKDIDIHRDMGTERHERMDAGVETCKVQEQNPAHLLLSLEFVFSLKTPSAIQKR